MMSALAASTLAFMSALTTVGYPIRALGEMAASVLIERIASGPAADREVVLQAQLLQRESTGPVPVR